MQATVRALLGKLADEVQATALAADRKHTATWCIEQLPALYDQLCQTNESRYGERIARLVGGVMKELAEGTPVCADARRLAASIPDRFGRLHEQLGLPRIGLKPSRRPSGR
jgi:hypothetical protein